MQNLAVKEFVVVTSKLCLTGARQERLGTVCVCLPEHQVGEAGNCVCVPEHQAGGAGNCVCVPEHQAGGAGNCVCVPEHLAGGAGNCVCVPEHQAGGAGNKVRIHCLSFLLFPDYICNSQPLAS